MTLRRDFLGFTAGTVAARTMAADRGQGGGGHRYGDAFACSPPGRGHAGGMRGV